MASAGTHRAPDRANEDADDEAAELIADSSPEDVERLWSELIQFKPDLQD